MDYKEKYNTALERARKIHHETEFDYEKGMMEEIFPELKEPNDEGYDAVDGVDILDIYSWLEKQGKQHPHVDVNKMVDKFAHTEVKGYGVPSMIEVDAYRRGIEAALKYCLTYQI